MPACPTAQVSVAGLESDNYDGSWGSDGDGTVPVFSAASDATLAVRSTHSVPDLG